MLRMLNGYDDDDAIVICIVSLLEHNLGSHYVSCYELISVNLKNTSVCDRILTGLSPPRK